jgi:hypothetical protein
VDLLIRDRQVRATSNGLTGQAQQADLLEEDQSLVAGTPVDESCTCS